MAKETLTVGPAARDLLAELNSFFRDRRVEAYVAGGFLRDALLGRDSRDVDISIAGDPLSLGRELAGALGGHYFPLAEERQAVRVLLPERSLYIDLLPLRGPIESDLQERDFTIDAMAAPLAEVVSGAVGVIDPSGGRKDLRQRLVRVVGEAAFRADSLRPLRGARLAVELDFAVEPGTAGLIRKYAPDLSQAAVERQRDELMRILCTVRAGQGLRLLDDLELLERLLPEMTDTRGVEQPKEHHWDVFDHSLEVVRNLDILLGEEEPPDRRWQELWGELWGQLAWWKEARAYFREELLAERPRSAVLKLGGTLHDIAKPQTKSFDDTGRMRFFGHADEGADKAGRVLRRLRFSAREVALVQTMVKAHLRPVQMGQQGPPTRRALYRYFRDCGDAAIGTLFLSLADHLGTVGPRVNLSDWRDHVALVNYILVKRFQEEETISPPKLVSGDELMAELNLSPGPLIGRLLEIVREAQGCGEISTREEALALAHSSLARKRSGKQADTHIGEER
ncbi:MAG: HD domain-containing protein [Dehalococcoidia bacterium]